MRRTFEERFDPEKYPAWPSHIFDPIFADVVGATDLGTNMTYKQWREINARCQALYERRGWPLPPTRHYMNKLESLAGAHAARIKTGAKIQKALRLLADYAILTKQQREANRPKMKRKSA